MKDNEDLSVQTLERLGLTKLQAKIYLASCCLKKSAVSKISALAKIARPDVYRVLPSLEELGLVRRVISNPTQYEAVPLKKGCCQLLSKKQIEYTKVKKSVDHMLKFHKDQENKQESDKSRFELVSSAKQLLKRLAIEDSLAQKTIDIMGNWRHIKPLLYGANNSFSNALKRGVKIRIITDDTLDEKFEKTIKTPLVEIRSLNGTVPIKTVIYDTTRANMYVGTLYDKRGLAPSLWSENPGFIKLLVAFYESNWLQAEPKFFMKTTW